MDRAYPLGVVISWCGESWPLECTPRDPCVLPNGSASHSYAAGLGLCATGLGGAGVAIPVCDGLMRSSYESARTICGLLLNGLRSHSATTSLRSLKGSASGDRSAGSGARAARDSGGAFGRARAHPRVCVCVCVCVRRCKPRNVLGA
jgi:hypothetical protein